MIPGDGVSTGYPMVTMSAQSDRFRVLHRLTEIRFEDELRGYSKNQVDRVLETLSPLAQDVEQLQDKLAAAERRAAAAEARLLEQRDSDGSSPAIAIASQPVPVPSQDFDETLRNTLVSAQRTADTIVREATQEADLTRSSANSEAEELTRSSRAESERLLAEGENARSSMFAEVEGERHALLAAARDRANAQITEIEAELEDVHAARREEILDQIRELEAVRDLLATDIENFEGHLAERREIVRSAMSEINTVLDDPERLRPAIPPQSTDVGALGEQSYEPARVELDSLLAVNDELDRAKTDGPHSEKDDVGNEGEASQEEITPDGVEPGGDDRQDRTEAIPVAALGDVAPETPSDNADGHGEDEAGIDLTDKVVIETEEPAQALFGDPTDLAEDPDGETATAGMTVSPASRMGVRRSLLMDTSQVGAVQEKTLGSADTDEDSVEDVERPAWAEAVPEASGDASSDPFLDELRKATTVEGEDDDALSRFMSQDTEEPTRSSWFGRRR